MIFRNLILVTVVVLGPAARAFAQPPDPLSTANQSSEPTEKERRAAERRARKHFTRGESQFQSGQFTEALASYDAGYAQLPLAGFLVNIAQCHRRLGDLPSARDAYRRFILAAPESPLIPEVRAILVEMEQMLRDLRDPAAAKASPPARPPVAREPEPLAQTPMPRPTQAATAQPGLDLAALPPKPAADHSKVFFWSGLGAALVGGAVTALVLASGSRNETIHEGSLGALRR